MPGTETKFCMKMFHESKKCINKMDIRVLSARAREEILAIWKQSRYVL